MKTIKTVITKEYDVNSGKLIKHTEVTTIEGTRHDDLLGTKPWNPYSPQTAPKFTCCNGGNG
ncbi:MAG: hypothetical protein ACM3KR_00635 [Deltaproteobacteria bacterium]